MKILMVFLLSFLAVSCNVDNLPDPIEICPAISPLFRSIEIYQEPLTGMSCSELTSGDMYQADEGPGCFQAYPVSMGNTEEMPPQNTIVSGIQEGRSIVFNEEIILKIDKNSVLVWQNNDSSQLLKNIQLKIKPKGLLMAENYLVIYSKEKLFLYSKVTFEKIQEYDFNSLRDVKIRDEQIIIVDQREKIKSESECRKIVYFDSSRFGVISIIHTIDLKEEILTLETNQSLYNVEIHTDIKNSYAYPKALDWESRRDLFLYNIDNETYKTYSGSIPSKFSLKEFDSNLVFFKEDQGNISLEILDEDLEVKNSIDNIAPRESVYSARFTDSSAYLVTFLQVDPLFKFDLSDIDSPMLTSELKIPGASHHLHFLGGNKVLGLGTADGRIFSDKVEISLFSEYENELERSDLLDLEGRLTYHVYRNHHNIHQNKDKVALFDGRSIIVLKVSENALDEIYYSRKHSEGTDFILFEDKIYIFNNDSFSLVRFDD